MTAVTPSRPHAAPPADTAVASCQWCGATAAGTDLVAWAFGREGLRITHACPTCVRHHLSEIETHFAL